MRVVLHGEEVGGGGFVGSLGYRDQAVWRNALEASARVLAHFEQQFRAHVHQGNLWRAIESEERREASSVAEKEERRIAEQVRLADLRRKADNILRFG